MEPLLTREEILDRLARLARGDVDDASYQRWVQEDLSEYSIQDVDYRKALLIDPRLNLFLVDADWLMNVDWAIDMEALGQNPMLVLWAEIASTEFLELVRMESTAWLQETLSLIFSGFTRDGLDFLIQAVEKHTGFSKIKNPYPVRSAGGDLIVSTAKWDIFVENKRHPFSHLNYDQIEYLANDSTRTILEFVQDQMPASNSLQRAVVVYKLIRDLERYFKIPSSPKLLTQFLEAELWSS